MRWAFLSVLESTVKMKAAGSDNRATSVQSSSIGWDSVFEKKGQKYLVKI